MPALIDRKIAKLETTIMALRGSQESRDALREDQRTISAMLRALERRHWVRIGELLSTFRGNDKLDVKRVKRASRLLGQIQDAQAGPGAMLRADWYVEQTIVRPGDLGPSAEWLGGAISPCCRVDFAGKRLLYVVGSEGPRPDDGGPAFRRLMAVEIDEDGHVTEDHGVVIEHFPSRGRQGDFEEGIFSAAAVVNGDDLILFVSEIILTSPGQVDVRPGAYVSHDGVEFNKLERYPFPGDPSPGEEYGPLAAAVVNGDDLIFAFVKQRPGWPDWSLAANGVIVTTDDGDVVRAIGASGPVRIQGDRYALLVVRPPVELEAPTIQWWSFDLSDPANFTLETNANMEGVVIVTLEPDLRQGYALDSWIDSTAKIVVVKPRR